MLDRDIVIVGAGATGVSSFCHFATQPGIRSLTLVDCNDIGRGTAYGDPEPLLKFNSSTVINSLFPDVPDDFLAYLRINGGSHDPHAMVSRGLYAPYCQQRFSEHAVAAAGYGITVKHVRAMVKKIHTSSGGGYHVVTDNGVRLPASDVVVTVGLREPKIPDGFGRYRRHHGLIASPFPTWRLRNRLGSQARVLIVGTRASAIDAALVLNRDGHQCTFTSRSGCLPAVRTRTCLPTGRFPSLESIRSLAAGDLLISEKLRRAVIEAIHSISDRPLRRQVVADGPNPIERLRQETALAETGAVCWQDVLMEILEVARAWFLTLPTSTVNELLRGYHTFIYRYIAAMPLPTARKLLALIDADALAIAPGYPTGVYREAGRWRVTWPGGDTSRFDAVVCATGFLKPVLSFDKHNTIHLAVESARRPAHCAFDNDLRVVFPGRGRAERVWIAGAGTYPRIPVSHFLRAATQQAREIALQSPWPETHPCL